MGAKTKAVPMEGRVFGALTILGRAGTHPVSRAALWHAVCDCGEEVVVDGVSVRKGNRRSCGCRNPHLKKEASVAKMTSTRGEIRTVMSETSRWVVDESDGTTFLLRRLGSGRTALVDHDCDRWVCSEDGPQQGRRGSATGQCAHVQVVGRSLPVSMAQTLAEKIAAPTAKRGHPDAVDKAERAQRRTEADIIAAGADIRADRARAHDESFVAATPVVVRQMTEADRLKLDAARARKARSFEVPERSRRFAG